LGWFDGCDGVSGGGAAAWTVGAGGDATVVVVVVVVVVGGGGGGAGAGAGVGFGSGFGSGFGCGLGCGVDGCGGEDCGAGVGAAGVATATIGCAAGCTTWCWGGTCEPAALCGAIRAGGMRTTFGAGAGWTTRGVPATRTSGVLDSNAARQRYPEAAPAATSAQSRSASNGIRTRMIIGPVDDSIGVDFGLR
jgi:hypothetical protein